MQTDGEQGVGGGAGGVTRARDLVYRRVARQAGLYPELGIEPLDTAGLDERDAALAHAIYEAVLRRWLTLEFLLEGWLGQRLAKMEPRLQGVLLAGAAQLLLLDRIPAHAAINESVQWAKTVIRPGAGSMVNAVLRKVAGMRGAKKETWDRGRDESPLGDGRALGLVQEFLPAGYPERLAVAASCPVRLLERWAKAFGKERAQGLAWHGLASPPVVLNTAFAGAGGLEGLPVQPHEMEGHAVFEGSRSKLLELLRTRVDLWVQDAGSGLAVRAAADLKPALVMDVCAGQGTKTRQLAATFPGAEIVATDIDEQRLRTLRGVFAGSGRVRVIGAGELGAYAGRADLVLLDVPCSNTGVLARRLEARYRKQDEQIARLTRTQEGIVDAARGLLAPGGAILYSTCSLEPEEDEAQVEGAVKMHGLVLERSGKHLPTGGPGQGTRTYSDGSYFGLLRRR
jgi:16S rRNA (cytosine967-C5)-methyltransferase